MRASCFCRTVPVEPAAEVIMMCKKDKEHVVLIFETDLYMLICGGGMCERR